MLEAGAEASILMADTVPGCRTTALCRAPTALQTTRTGPEEKREKTGGEGKREKKEGLGVSEVPCIQSCRGGEKQAT